MGKGEETSSLFTLLFVFFSLHKGNIYVRGIDGGDLLLAQNPFEVG